MKLSPAFLLVSSLFSCSHPALPASPTEIPTASPDDQLARQTLADFINALHSGQYEEAARLYGGSYEMHISQNPDLDPQDHAALFQNACSTNGFMCLQTLTIEEEPSLSDTEFTFMVQFQNADGSQFIQGPCCGESETDSPPISDFPFRVVKDPSGNMLVLDMVPYIP